MKKLLRYLFWSMLVLATPLIMGVVTYLINPAYVQEKVLDWFWPTVNLPVQAASEISVDVPAVYELLQVACQLTPTYRNDPNLHRPGAPYYEEVLAHFGPHSNHPLIQRLEASFGGGYGPSHISVRILSLNYDLDSAGHITPNNFFHVSDVVRWALRRNLFFPSEHIDLINDFSIATDFKTFYNQHRPYYRQLIDNYHRLCDFEGIRQWLGAKFDGSSPHAYRIIFSPLTGGFHNTLNFRFSNGEARADFMFVGPPFRNIDSLSPEELVIRKSKVARMVFTEIDHNYVNPLTEKFAEAVDSAIADLDDWNRQSSYRSKAMTFNEYMTWGLFSLYALDIYPAAYIDTLIGIQEAFMEQQRKFVRFRAFNRELMRQYIEMGRPPIRRLYRPMLAWMASYSEPEAAP